MNKKQWIVTGTITALAAIVAMAVFYYYYFQPIEVRRPTMPTPVAKHLFKVKEIYPTKPGGREWFINMADPHADKLFDPDALIQKEPDGSWRIGQTADGSDEDHVRMKVTTPEGQPEWKNVEITGYVKALWADSPTDHVDWYARGGRHSNSAPCEGSALKGWISVDGTVSWIKEIWHKEGYTKSRDRHKVTDSLLNRWIGWKVIMYNIDNDKAVKMESYIDDNDKTIGEKYPKLLIMAGGLVEVQMKNFIALVAQGQRTI
jgi:hypothetical protein